MVVLFGIYKKIISNKILLVMFIYVAGQLEAMAYSPQTDGVVFEEGEGEKESDFYSVFSEVLLIKSYKNIETCKYQMRMTFDQAYLTFLVVMLHLNVFLSVHHPQLQVCGFYLNNCHTGPLSTVFIVYYLLQTYIVRLSVCIHCVYVCSLFSSAVEANKHVYLSSC